MKTYVFILEKKNSVLTCFLLKPFGQISSEVKVDSFIPRRAYSTAEMSQHSGENELLFDSVRNFF